MCNWWLILSGERSDYNISWWQIQLHNLPISDQLLKKCLGQNFRHFATKTSLIHGFVFAKNKCHSRQILCFFPPPSWNFHIYTIGCSMSQKFLFSSMACSQIWLSPLVDDSQPTNLTDFPKNKKKPLVQTNCQNIVGFFILKTYFPLVDH